MNLYIKRKGYREQIIHPKDYGFDFSYEDIIFTSKKLQKKIQLL